MRAFLLRHLVACVCLICGLLPQMAWAQASGRYFLEGDGILRLHNLKTGKRGTVQYRLPDGIYLGSGQEEIDVLFGLKADPAVASISLRFIALLDYIEDQFGAGAKAIEMNSAYRSPRYNKKLRGQGQTVAKASTHMEGMAADIQIRGVKGQTLWEEIRSWNCCGAGWYGGASVHVDSADARFWTGETAKVETGISDNNKKILLVTDYDRYQPDKTIKLNLLRITELPFGIKERAALIMQKGDREKRLNKITLKYNDELEKKKGCIMIHDRRQARLLSAQLPRKIRKQSEPLSIKIDFCNKPSEEMPDSVVSNRIEINE